MKRKRRVPQVAGHQGAQTLHGLPVARTLDLHGLSAAQAKRRVRDFIITASRSASGQVVRIVTGWGKGRDSASVLVPLVRELIVTTLASYVAEHAIDGGSYLVRIR